MDWFESIILGIVQGVTEFIPVSSSGHLVATQTFLLGQSSHLLIQFLDLGTTLVLVIYFWRKIIEILRDVFVRRNFKLARNILITAIPAAAVGYLLAGFIETTPFFGNLCVVAIALTLVGVVMIVLEKLPRKAPVKSLEQLPWKRALAIGLAQVLALIPGVSRSGSTIIAGRLSGFNPEQAAQYSFLVSLPIMLGVSAKVLISNHDYLVANMSTVVISNIAAFVAGILAVSFLLRYLSRHSLAIFGWYRVALGLVLITVGLVVI